MNSNDQDRVATALLRYLRRLSRFGGARPRLQLVDEFELRERMEGLIRLHSGALLSTGERVLSVAHSLEKLN